MVKTPAYSEKSKTHSLLQTDSPE